MPLSIIQYLLTVVTVFGFINLVLIQKLNTQSRFSFLLKFFSIYLIIHAIYIICIEQFFGEVDWLDRYAPFSLMYGPFLYFAICAVNNKGFSLVQISLHAFPFVAFTLGFLSIIILKPQQLMFTYYNALNIFTVISFSAYTSIALFMNTQPIGDHFKQRKLIVLGAVIILLFVSIIAIVALVSTKQLISKPNAILLLRTMTYSCMLIISLMIFKYQLNLLFLKIDKPSSFTINSTVAGISIDDRTAKYEKSNLTYRQLDEYGKKLEKLMVSQRVYLSTDLSLQKLAQLLRIPNHHLTQVLSLKIKMGFYEYVNGFRVQYACLLLENEPNINLELVAEKSGFNSKVSFNRHFKSVLGCTPSEYRNQQKDFNSTVNFES